MTAARRRDLAPASAEVGQGLITVEQQICRTELGVERVVVHPKDTAVAPAGRRPRPADVRDRWRGQGRVQAVRTLVLERAAITLARPAASCGWTRQIVGASGEVLTGLAEVLGDEAVEETRMRHRPTHAIDPRPGRATRTCIRLLRPPAVVDVEVDSGW